MRGDVWSFPALAGKSFPKKTEHPMQKTETLITEIIKAFCPQKKMVYMKKLFLIRFMDLVLYEYAAKNSICRDTRLNGLELN